MKTIVSYYDLTGGKLRGLLHINLNLCDHPIPSEGDRVTLLGHHEFGDIRLRVINVEHEFALGSTNERGKTIETSLTIHIIGERVG